MAESGFGFWKILAILMVIVTIGSCAALTSAVDVVSESNRNTSPATSYMPDNYSLIRVAVDNASFGDMIVVYNETYEENVTVNRLGALAVQMNNFTDSVTSVSEWETAKILTLLSTNTDSIQLISVTPPAGTTLQRGTVVPFEVTVDYNLASVATGFVEAELGLSTGRCVIMGREEIMQGHGTAIIHGSINVDHLYKWVQSDTVYLALSLGYKKDPTHSHLLIWKHMPDQYYFISSATPPGARPVITSPLEITPEKDKYYVCDTLTAKFTIKNIGNEPITFDKLLVGGRFNGGKLPNGEYPDFTPQSLTLDPGQSQQYEGTLKLTEGGDYLFFCAYQTPDGEWNTCIDLGPGLTDEDRVKDIEVLLPEGPHICSIDPSSGAPGIQVTIKGRNLKGFLSGSVDFGSISIPIGLVESLSDNEIVVRVPPTPPTQQLPPEKRKVDVIVIADGRKSNPVKFTSCVFG